MLNQEINKEFEKTRPSFCVIASLTAAHYFEIAIKKTDYIYQETIIDDFEGLKAKPRVTSITFDNHTTNIIFIRQCSSKDFKIDTWRKYLLTKNKSLMTWYQRLLK